MNVALSEALMRIENFQQKTRGQESVHKWKRNQVKVFHQMRVTDRGLSKEDM